ncbi:MAG: ABC transporter permease [Pseudanabaenaceae cyanobacterium bins.68]|nr:ABC transporter permease [Pseudanabaenaceae cyanobacterium bins.68]
MSSLFQLPGQISQWCDRAWHRFLSLLPQPWSITLDLLISLVQRDLSSKYQGSVLGNLWPLINQLFQLLIYTYVFSIILKVKLDLPGATNSNFTFGLWAFAGLVPWFAFTTGFLQSASAVVHQPNLVKKVVFPLELLPLVPVLSAFVESTMGLIVLVVAVSLILKVAHGTLLLLPLVWLTQLLLTAGLSYLAAGLTVFLRDIPQTIGVILNLWFYLTPIVYPAKAIPAAWRVWITWLNPLAVICELYRDLILVGRVDHLGEWLVTLAIASLVYALGWYCYQRLRPAFADVL